MTNIINGSCLCGAVTFKLKDEFDTFNICHCKQCQQMSGSAHMANLFTATDNIEWLSGEDQIMTYDVPGREIRNSFCKSCGCNLPYITISGRSLLVPSGSLETEPVTTPEQVIFWKERMSWYDDIHNVEKFDHWRK
ncbi:GFA family protein [Pseudemcibacter aquimaris]|uniref:GFA family protein n=1 Tax=Pseudemcibacter aquimaris TaxID=2857064 RepID=UPI0020118F5B|nr:GFA family protein [Pseudemcibacter aquimaris]MCC3859716.1 GFA family protein [Pseudemcibacter aquimaris]WDU60111.1 GFA family protein [Pseudemcibacter aquimaris]